MPEHLAPNLAEADLVNRQLCVILDREYGLEMSRIAESLESGLPSAEEAKVLRIRRTTPLLLLRQEITDARGTAFEYSRILVRGDKIRLEFEYQLGTATSTGVGGPTWAGSHGGDPPPRPSRR